MRNNNTDLTKRSDEELLELAVRDTLENHIVTDIEIEISGQPLSAKIIRPPYNGPSREEVEQEVARRIAGEYNLDREKFEEARTDWVFNEGDSPAVDKMIAFREARMDSVKERLNDIVAKALTTGINQSAGFSR